MWLIWVVTQRFSYGCEGDSVLVLVLVIPPGVQNMGNWKMLSRYQYLWISFEICLLTIQEKVKRLYSVDTVENCAFSLRDLSVTWASISRVIIIRPLSSPGTTVLSSDIQNRLYMYCLRYKPLGDQKRIDPIHVQLSVPSGALVWRGGAGMLVGKKSLLDQSGGYLKLYLTPKRHH